MINVEYHIFRKISFASALWLSLVIGLSSCASYKSIIKSDTYENVMIGRNIKYNTTIESREATPYVLVDIIIDETVKGKIETIDERYPIGPISTITELVCIDEDVSCADQKVGYFGYFGIKYNYPSTATIIKSEKTNEICEQVILLFNKCSARCTITKGNQSAPMYDLGFIDIVELPEKEFQKEIQYLKAIKAK